MLFFKNDYSIGAHPQVLQALVDNNLVFSDSYGHDSFCGKTAETVRELFKATAADVFFFSGGTQANKVCLAAFLRPYEAAIAADSAHICVHETGAIESTGHKCIAVPATQGKIRPEQIDQVMAFHNFDQMVKPKLVYVSNTTELGSVYSKDELTALRRCCDQHGLYLYIDGARMAMALGAQHSNLTYEDYPRLADVFYVGGTKCGALFGEMVVIVNPVLKPDFRYVMRQNGALFAKGMTIGMQFSALFEDNLYLHLGQKANNLALDLAAKIRAKGYRLQYEPESNQIFPVFTKDKVADLAKQVMFENWLDNGDGTLTVRFVTSWATKQEDVDALAALL